MYYLPKPMSEANLKRMRRIDALHLEHPFAGARMLRDLLRQDGIHVGRNLVVATPAATFDISILRASIFLTLFNASEKTPPPQPTSRVLDI